MLASKSILLTSMVPFLLLQGALAFETREEREARATRLALGLGIAFTVLIVLCCIGCCIGWFMGCFSCFQSMNKNKTGDQQPAHAPMPPPPQQATGGQYVQPGYAQPGYAQPGYAQPGYAQPPPPQQTTVDYAQPPPQGARVDTAQPVSDNI